MVLWREVATLCANRIQYVCHVVLWLKSVNFSLQPAAATANVTAVTAVKPLSTGTPVKLPVTGPPAQAISQKAVSVKAEGTTVAQTSASTVRKKKFLIKN